MPPLVFGEAFCFLLYLHVSSSVISHNIAFFLQ